MNILGINCFSHDTSACLLSEGEPVAFAEEERFLRTKHTKAFPHKAVAYCLEEGSLEIADVDYVAFTYRPVLDYARAFRDFLRRFPLSAKRFAVQTAVDGMLLYRGHEFKKNYGYKGKLIFVGHHDAHAASGYYPSGFEEAAILSIDRGGDYLSTLLCKGTGNRIVTIKKMRNPHSVGSLYTAVTEYLGFTPNSGEGKVMGLAPYGDLELLDEFRKIVELKPDGDFKLDLSYFRYSATRFQTSEKFHRIFGPPRVPESAMERRYENIARALQEVTEEIALHVCRYLYERAGSKNLCIAGGVGLNSVMNERLFRELPFEDIFVQPSANDAGTALGAALWVEHMVLGRPRKYEMVHPYYGPGYTEEEILECIRKRKAKYSIVDDPGAYAAEALARGRIVGWFQGRMEMGPRALGNRSILADVRGKDMKDILNREVKHREGFRPFAPTILEEDGADYFEDYYPAPFMLLVLPIKKEKQDVIPAVVHVDETGRLQTLDRSANPQYRHLIERFKELTGVPIVLNTSFNIRGEPIVMTPDDALNCYFFTGIDTLVIGNCVLEKES
jgi:carbamoyltransferase